MHRCALDSRGSDPGLRPRVEIGEPLGRLAQASGGQFPNLMRARALTHERLTERKPHLKELPHDEDASIVLMGSWGRSEMTQMRAFLDERLRMPPADRVAEAFLTYDAADAGGRTLAAYDRFVGMLDDQVCRDELEALTRTDAPSSAVFLEAKRLGKEIESGLLALLFECEPFPKIVRDYAIF